MAEETVLLLDSFLFQDKKDYSFLVSFKGNITLFSESDLCAKKAVLEGQRSYRKEKKKKRKKKLDLENFMFYHLVLILGF